ncbi:hypothetical protein WALSEDRAFT_61766 [Wallemia mellicola CBS 633.66]|uniref:Protein FRA10AC1 n=1 Tax=Wallemia mellicola (strain ATCC MYA-4683 / CBS 633.66) TaxID=671144 RepID=I4YIZ5_WALMC|nr:hypothetical protein WALSEDRAFT_61766 [Wallemia mellicola CBS 633.66]EIM23937.1 hypothetical protein WALSEDRAFT_61766 [Wallemia mellicola CBS 633.66]|eukprot:XP_006955776.1 hypothetical protein WALSEDRAFT_61766 [Wallemia mellicola CBS 633.66]
MSKNAYDRHKQWKYEQEKIYRRDFNLEAERDKGVTEFDLIKQNHKFLKDEDLYDSDEEVKETTEEVTDPYAQKLSDKYYDSLYKEFAIADLKHYKTQISLRWRTKQEVVDGVGETSCANIRCMTRESKLIPFELPFNYKENDIAKNAEVKVVLCRHCSKKLSYKQDKDKEENLIRSRREHNRSRSPESRKKRPS